MATTTTSLSKSTNQIWPFVVVPDFEKRAEAVSSLAHASMIMLAPIVPSSERAEWNSFSSKNRNWTTSNYTSVQGVRAYDEADLTSANFHVPAWQYGPGVVDPSLVNIDLYTNSAFQHVIEDAIEIGDAAVSQVTDLSFVLGYTEQTQDIEPHPRSIFLQPVRRDFQEDSPIAAFIIAVESWASFFKNALPAGLDGFIIDVSGSCGSKNTFMVNGPNAVFIGQGGLYNNKYEDLAVRKQIDAFSHHSTDECKYTLTVYPTETFEEEYYTSKPYVYAGVVLAMFALTALVFYTYDRMVTRQQQELLSKAARTKKIVTSLFPEAAAERLIKQAEIDEESGATKNNKKESSKFLAKANLKDYLDGQEANRVHGDDPIADFFSDTTILFADICGFTAWSSTREPKQVFQLLESVFHEFDSIAKRRKVFKVETVGDCYVAVVGLPEPREDHAVVMARFARDCLFRFRAVSKQLEVELGPSTADLGVRIGLHSGPVTAGVLRGEKARFQLFGDTMNTASRIETTGKANRIHISQETGDLLQQAGKGHWLQARVEKVEAKGKGQLKTYWLDLKSATEGGKDKESSDGSDHGAIEEEEERSPAVDIVLDEKTSRLVKWNVDILSRYLRKIVARRQADGNACEPMHRILTEEVMDKRKEGTVLDYTKDTINMPHYNAAAEKRRIDPESIKLGENVEEQLLKYVQTIAAMYRENPFHNFEHATHVTMSVVKLLNRIVAPDLGDKSDNTKLVHDHTYGITSDPLTSFAVILAALLHDVDHQGVTNATLVSEKAIVAAVYRNKSVAEQNSFSLGWSLLLEDDYSEFRHCIYANTAEFHRFKQLLVNTILATDIMDKDLGTARKERWNAAFSEQAPDEADTSMQDRKATIVIEHLIQASDVAHTMQHWQIYRKWNARLFKEMYHAHKIGRSKLNPAVIWYKGEIGFLDNYVIPLARKLKNCGVFGVSSDEYLNYAQQNRKLWEDKGEELVEELIASVTAESENERVVAS